MVFAIAAILFLTAGSLLYLPSPVSELSEDQSSSLRIEERNIEKVFLESHIAQNNGPARVEFLAVNDAACPAECRVDWVSCGCIDLTVDGKPYSTRSPWTVNAEGGSSVIAVSSQLPLPGKTVDRAFDVVTTSTDNPGSEVSIRCQMRLTVHKDIAAFPTRVRITTGHGTADPASSNVALEIMSSSNDDFVPWMELSHGLGNIVDASINRVKPPIAISNTIYQHSFQLTLSVKPTQLEHISTGVHGAIRVAKRQDESETPGILLPVQIQDSRRLLAPSQVDFGDIPIGVESNRSFSVMSIGEDPFVLSLAKVTHEHGKLDCQCEVKANTPAKFSIANLSIVGSQPGLCSGRIHIATEGGHYFPLEIPFRAMVVEN